MTAADGSAAPARIAIALGGGELPAALGAVLRHVAARPGAECRAFYIEDADLLKAVALPFAVEFCGLTSVRRPITPERVEAIFRREAAAAEQGFARVAAAAGVHWRFEVVREGRGQVLSATVRTTDIVVVTPSGEGDRIPERPREASGGRTHAAARAAAGSAPIVVIADATEGGRRALTFARTVAAAEGAALEVYVTAEDATRDGTDERIATPGTTPLRAHDVLRMLCRRDARLVVVAATVLERPDLMPALREFYETGGAPLVVMR